MIKNEVDAKKRKMAAAFSQTGELSIYYLPFQCIISNLIAVGKRKINKHIEQKASRRIYVHPVWPGRSAFKLTRNMKKQE